MIKLPLTRGQHSLIDDEDYERVSAYSWHAQPWRTDKTKFYGKYDSGRRPGGKRVRMWLHRFILDAPEHLYVDHINGDSLDNRRANLRLCTSAQNNSNSSRQVGATGFRGVVQAGPTWYAQIRCEKRFIYLGRHRSAIEAAKAYDEAAKIYHGVFARLNFPEAA